MIDILILSTLLCNVVYSAGNNEIYYQNVTQKQFIYNTYEYDTVINVVVNDTTEQILDFHEESEASDGAPTRVHISTNTSITTEHPLFVTATQQKGVSSWELPLVVRARRVVQLDDMARTLCPHDAGTNTTAATRPTLHISTSSVTNVSVDIKVRRVRDFYLQIDKEIEVTVSPSTPKYYLFSFASSPGNRTNTTLLPHFNYTVPKSVIVMLESDSSLCAVVSIQNNSCPVFDNEEDMLYQGYHFTMTTKGGITLTQSMFPGGFHVVLMVKQSDEECTGVSETVASDWDGDIQRIDGRLKTFRVKVIATISYAEYAQGAALVLAALAAVLALTLVAALPRYSCRCTEEVVIVEEEAGPSTSRAEDGAPMLPPRPDDLDESASECEVWGEDMPELTVAQLNRTRPAALLRRSNRYFWSAVTMAIVYALPVIQLLAMYQRMSRETGDRDVCYYNWVCAHPLGPLADFNHVYSNVGYVALGLAFMAQVRARNNLPQDTGIPQHRGLFYSMGVSLAMEGVLSACYHLCPNKMNFQFDSSFMYVTAVLVMVKLYQNRHPDVNADAHSSFLLLAAIMAIGLCGIMYPSVWFWACFTALHVAACCLLSLNMYYVGRVSLGRVGVKRAWLRVRTLRARALVPRYRARAILLALANLANWALAAYGLYEHKKDFARHLLAVLLGNAVLHTLCYVCMKLVHGERVAPHACLYLLLSHAAWLLAAYFFVDARTKWSETPAQSRVHNAPCSWLRMFDSHDAWHVTSAAAIFLYFNALLTVDDELALRPRDTIPVF